MRTFPDDLVRVQREWSATYRQLADRPGRTELRRRLHRLSVRAFFHPYWRQRRPSPAAWWELRELAHRAGDTSGRVAR
ncbi:hypothetical protein ACH4C6_15200 [Streptomyces sp. NPDC017943]|uniref:hypothetical protein n=1 Tax=Streptomyces sp. NPDC017943 TaxID=3365019 RepID=UPI0037B4D795